jgi:hypothetical protein
MAYPIVMKLVGKSLFTCLHPLPLLVEKPEGEVFFIKIFPNHGKQWKIIGVIFFVVELVPTHLSW